MCLVAFLFQSYGTREHSAGIQSYRRKNREIVRDYKIHDERPRTRTELPARIVFHVTLTSVDSYRCDSHCLARLCENMPAPPKHYGVFDVLPIRKVFAEAKKPGSH